MGNEEISVIMVPFPAQGHLNQMLQLSCHISSYKIPVHYVGSAVFNRQARLRANALNPTDVDKIIFQDLPVPPFASPPPLPNPTKKFPTHLQPAWDAATSMVGPLGDLMRSLALEHRRVIVIHDPLIASVVKDVANIPNAESYAFICLSAYCQVKFITEMMGITCPIPRLRELPPVSATISEELYSFIGLQDEGMALRSGDIINTCRSVEGPFLEILESKEIAGGLKSWAIGPLIPEKPSKSESHNQIFMWLDKQGPRSVIFVSFGTTTTLTDHEVQVIAEGLERSGQKFIWVLREADTANVFDREARRVELPEGFEERVKERGVVVREWAPQPEILAHPSTGGFMSHCGWNSCNESIKMGVPIAAWPMHSDQPTNAVFITEVLKVGLPVRRWGEVVTVEMVEDAVRRLIESEEGGEARKKAEELAAVVRGATEEGGASRLELDAFIAHITRQ
ncbi:zeatin O-glucosyltransferase-like [Salvia hispanica]|uniref:zeatin O-glucosyltransferase-like n=1 Tax=Salvia hispanica TaxID=49212 RepID=UPI002009A998|nr:zeatin O-glucosyltransferase-like [Salvia hispanica]XP_047963858.1 zeatin O-glucosyltransferase-like [Salvia hispanica]